MIRIILFEDQEDVRESLQFILNSFADFTVAGAFGDGLHAVDQVATLHPNVVLMDIDMPGKSGIETLTDIRKVNKTLPIVMLTAYESEQRIVEAIKAGANGYLLKNQKMDQLVQGIREAHEGSTPMSPQVAKKVWNMFKLQSTTHTVDIRDCKLTDREKEVLQALMAGASYKMISDKLNISFSTVHSHLKNIYKKFGVNSMGEALSIAYQNGLI